jgi:5,6-dimethylbenzimidazole synthase
MSEPSDDRAAIGRAVAAQTAPRALSGSAATVSTAPSAPDDAAPPIFDQAFQARFAQLVAWRRDVRRFHRDPIPGAVLDELIAGACRAPSVGHSQPWRFVLVEDAARRAAIRDNFAECNRAALAGYDGKRARAYAGLKLAGLDDAPVQLAVFADLATADGHGLGRRTMPETVEYSVVGAVTLLWLAARAQGIGVGWVSILDPARAHAALEIPETWRLIAYLCIGYPAALSAEPELARAGWQPRRDWREFLLRR